MRKDIFYRNIRARDHLELFLLAAATSLLLVRLYLHLAGYPQIGSGGLHIAHMLWGGALMVCAIAIALSFLGSRALRAAALVGGVGFGIFIDELGKFITRDNNYFYQPAIGIIYAVFIVLYLAFNFVSRNRPLSNREYQLNALDQMQEAILHDMSPAEKQRVQDLLQCADQHDPLTKQLHALLGNARLTKPGRPGKPRRFLRWLDRQYERFWLWRDSGLLVRGFFLVEVLLFVGGISWTIYHSLHGGFVALHDLPHTTLFAFGQLASALVAAAFAIAGTLRLRYSRLKAYEQFRRATLVTIFLTQFFTFVRIEFAALPGFFGNLVLLALLGYAIRHEQLHGHSK